MAPISLTRLGITAALALSLWGCGLPDGQLDILGTVEFVNVEGGCWRVRATDGTSYEPVNLAESFRVDGLRVAMILAPADAASICQVGRLVEIVDIRRR